MLETISVRQAPRGYSGQIVPPPRGYIAQTHRHAAALLKIIPEKIIAPRAGAGEAFQ